MYLSASHWLIPQILCRKEINYLKMSQKERDQLTAEFSILSSLKHPNIVGYFHREHLKQNQELYLYMEYCGGGDLGTVIKNLKKNNELAKEEFIWRIFSQLVTALYRCHYGVDPPEPGSDFARQKDTRIKGKNQSMMILHRDLKPENIFLGDDQSVKLGDFGLSKLMQSHDFASTYVGTPFYMSPEICAAEKYTLHSDIWSVGCIMYELCTKEPPFNANSHLQLVQRIRKGEVKPIPNVYSKDLQNVITSCLKTNPTHRPDTASLLSIPYVWIARRQQEMVSLGRSLKTREETAEYKLKQAEERLSAMESDRVVMRAEVESQVRREWEVKARLEIDRQIQIELEKLRKKFDKEVDEKVSMFVSKHNRMMETRSLKESHNSSHQSEAKENKENISHSSSINTAGDEDFPSSTDVTDLSELSLHSPSTSMSKPIPAKRSKTPFTRSKTTFDSPADVQMSEPSPMSISSLSLSPRRNATAQATTGVNSSASAVKNIFAQAARQKAKWKPTLAYSSDDEGDGDDGSDDDVPDLPSPTRPKMRAVDTDPFKMPMPLPSKTRPNLMRQNTTATMQQLTTKPTLFPTGVSTAATQVRAATANATASQIPRSATETDLRANAAKPTSPNKRLSRIPSRNDIASDIASSGSTSPLRRAATTGGATGLKSKLATPNLREGGNVVGGRTLVELAQARAGGRPVTTEYNKVVNGRLDRELPPVPVWDPELDEMPSPFLKREYKVIKGLR